VDKLESYDGDWPGLGESASSSCGFAGISLFDNQARSHAESTGMTLLGYYQATQSLDDEEGLSSVGQRITTNLRDKFKDAFALVVSNPFPPT
jgi:hypothetical protein